MVQCTAPHTSYDCLLCRLRFVAGCLDEFEFYNVASVLARHDILAMSCDALRKGRVSLAIHAYLVTVVIQTSDRAVLDLAVAKMRMVITKNRGLRDACLPFRPATCRVLLLRRDEAKVTQSVTERHSLTEFLEELDIGANCLPGHQTDRGEQPRKRIDIHPVRGLAGDKLTGHRACSYAEVHQRENASKRTRRSAEAGAQRRAPYGSLQKSARLPAHLAG